VKKEESEVSASPDLFVKEGKKQHVSYNTATDLSTKKDLSWGDLNVVSTDTTFKSRRRTFSFLNKKIQLHVGEISPR
jgi:hypothetical protein